MKICLPTQSVSSLTTFILVCVFAVLGVPATPQPACKRAEMISRASDELRQRVREAVEKRRAIESELAEIEKQMQEVEGRRRERERELLRDYDQEIQKREGATKELTEMINLLSVADGTRPCDVSAICSFTLPSQKSIGSSNNASLAHDSPMSLERRFPSQAKHQSNQAKNYKHRKPTLRTGAKFS